MWKYLIHKLYMQKCDIIILVYFKLKNLVTYKLYGILYIIFDKILRNIVMILWIDSRLSSETIAFAFV